MQITWTKCSEQMPGWEPDNKLICRFSSEADYIVVEDFKYDINRKGFVNPVNQYNAMELDIEWTTFTSEKWNSCIKSTQALR